MKTTKGFVLGIAAIGLLALSAVAPTTAAAGPTPPPPGQLVRLLAKNFTAWSDFDAFFATTDSPSVINFYAQTVKAQAGANVMDVLVSFQFINDDEPFGIQCIVDGGACMNGATDPIAAALLFPAGTIVMADIGDDDLGASTYNFCQTIAKTTKNLHSVVLNLLTVFDETELFAIDVEVTAARVKDPTLACAPGAVQGAPDL